MKFDTMFIPQNVEDLLELTSLIVLKAPQFKDKTGYFPDRNLDYVFQQLNEGLTNTRATLGDDRYRELTRMSDQMRALFEADPDDKTGETLQGCKIIQAMEDILEQARRTS